MYVCKVVLLKANLVPRRSNSCLEEGRGEHLVHTFVRVHLISNQLLRNKQKMTISNGLGFLDDVCRWCTKWSTWMFVRDQVRELDVC